KNQVEASDLANRASDAVGTAIVHGASAITETLGLGRIVPAKELDQVEQPPPSPDAPKVPQSRRRDAPGAPSQQIAAIVAFDLEPVQPAGETGPPAHPEATATADSTIPQVQPDEDNTIYSF